MSRRRKKIRHMALKIYAVDACMLMLAISTTDLIKSQETRNRAQQIPCFTTVYALDSEVEQSTKSTAWRGVSRRTAPMQAVAAVEKVAPIENAASTETESQMEDSDGEILKQIAMAEAEGESVEGKALVMRVVLNRVQSDSFPDSVQDVVFQEGQFEPVWNGRYYSVEPDEGCLEAYEMILDGWDESDGALYFVAADCQNHWHRNNLTYLFTVGNHEFYK